MKHFILFLVLFSMVIFCSCKNNSLTEPETSDTNPLPRPPITTIADHIPFQNLDQAGKLVFQRIGPVGSNYVYVVLLDLSKQKDSILQIEGNGVAISPDGKNICYTSNAGGQSFPWDTFIASIDGSTIQDISEINGQDQYPSWSADSKSVFFYLPVVPYTGHKILYNVQLNNISDKRNIADFLDLYPFTHFDQSSSGKLCFGARNGTGAKLHSLEIINSKPSIQVLMDSTNTFYTPRWSLDGNKIAFISEGPPANGQSLGFLSATASLLIFDFRTKSISKIFEWDISQSTSWSGFNELSVCWSPNGKQLAFNKIGIGLESHIYLINDDGSNLIQITNLSGVCDRSVSWSVR